MAIYSYIKVNTGSPFGAELNPVKFSYTIIGELSGRTYIETDETNIPVQNTIIDFRKENHNPIQDQKELEETIRLTEETITNTAKRLKEIKDEFITAVLLDDTEIMTALKSEYKELMEDA